MRTPSSRYRNSYRTNRFPVLTWKLGRHVDSRFSFAVTIGLAGLGVDRKAVVVPDQRMAEIGQISLAVFGLSIIPCVRIGCRFMGLVAEFVAVQIALGVAAAAAFIVVLFIMATVFY